MSLPLTKTFCVLLVLGSLLLLSWNNTSATLPGDIDNGGGGGGSGGGVGATPPLWTFNGATHLLTTPVDRGNETVRARQAAFGRSVDDERQIDLYITDDGANGCDDAHYAGWLDVVRRAGNERVASHVVDHETIALAATHDKQAAQGTKRAADQTWILLQRGECAFVDKVRRAQRLADSAGANGSRVGVVIGDDGSSYDSLVTMFARDAADVDLPSLFVTRSSYGVLRQAAYGDRLLRIRLEPQELGTDWPLLDTLVFICLSPLCTLLVVYAILHLRRRRLHRQNILPPDYVARLPLLPFLAKEGVNGDCVICLESFVEDEEVLQLPCKHLYHAPCVTRWLVERKRICPICKRDVAKGVDGVVDEQEVEASIGVARPSTVRSLSSAAEHVQTTTASQEQSTESTPLLQQQRQEQQQ